jgi:hypothetical protein
MHATLEGEVRELLESFWDRGAKCKHI